MLKEFVKYYKPHMRLFLTDLLCALIVAICNLLYPFLAQQILNNSNLSNDLMLIVYIGLALLGIYILKAVLNNIIFDTKNDENVDTAKLLKNIKLSLEEKI